MKVTPEMISRFLGWRLPQNFGPDCGITFTKPDHPASWPTGTNLLDSEQAKQMLEHVLNGEPAQADNAAWRKLALQFDQHRMQAIWHLRAMVENPQAHREVAEEFLKAQPNKL